MGPLHTQDPDCKMGHVQAQYIFFLMYTWIRLAKVPCTPGILSKSVMLCSLAWYLVRIHHSLQSPLSSIRPFQAYGWSKYSVKGIFHLEHEVLKWGRTFLVSACENTSLFLLQWFNATSIRWFLAWNCLFYTWYIPKAWYFQGMRLVAPPAALMQ